MLLGLSAEYWHLACRTSCTSGTKPVHVKSETGSLVADQQDVRQRLNLRWGVMPFLMEFDPNPEANTYKTFNLLKTRQMISPGDLVIVVSDLKPDDGTVVRGIQLRRVPPNSPS